MTGLSTSCPSRSDPLRSSPPVKVAVIACGALGLSIRQVVARRGWQVELHVLPPLLHNHPRDIAPRVESLARALQAAGAAVVLAYADCGTYGALDEVCERLQIRRLRGLHCYDVFAGAERIRKIFEDDPGTYVLTDFLVHSFRRTVLSELGLDRHPELWGDYFGNYNRVVWLSQAHSAALEEEARDIAALFGLPLTILDVGLDGLELELAELLGADRATAAAPAVNPPSATTQVLVTGGPLPGRQRGL